MAIEKQIVINANTAPAEKNLNDVVDVLKEIQKQGEKNEQSFKDTEKAIKNVEKGTNLLAKGFKGAGLALKAMGIGLALEAFAILKDLFTSNQQVADFFGTAIKGLGIVFNDLFSFVFDNVPKVAEFFKQIFENPTESLKELGEAIKNNLIERFTSAIEVAGFLSEALMKVFKGDFAGALDSVKEAGKEFVDVMTGIDGTTEIVAEGVTKLAGAVSEYAKETWNSAEALQAQENNALLAVAQQARLVEQYDRQAEQLRQIRDNDLLSIEERIKANDELAEVLEAQEKAMIAQAKAQTLSAQNALRLNNTIENQVALTEALANEEGVLAQIEGFRSEQKTNAVALEKELLDLNKIRTKSETELAFKQKQFAVEQIKDDVARLEAKKALIEEERAIDLQQLEDNINLYQEGTQARLDAEIEFNTRKQELDQQATLAENELADLKAKKQAEELAREQALNQSKLQMASSYFVDISAILGQQNKIGKKFAIAQALMNTYQGISNVWSEKAESGLVGAGLVQRLATTAIVAAQGFATVKNIMKTQPTGGGSPSGTSGGGGSAPPAFNIVGTSGVNQIAEQLGQQQEPVQAFVVGSNVTTQQEMDRNIVTTATLG